MLLQVIICSTRPGRVGKSIAEWFFEHARTNGKFDVELVDLADFDLPVFDEPRHPRLADYEHEHTKRWSASVARADAFAFVTPEYNYGPPSSLVNAFDFISKEWAYKPAGFVSYGGASSGLRGVQLARPIVTALNMMPIPQGVAIPFFMNHLDAATGKFDPGQGQVDASHAMINELHRWAGALEPLRRG